MIAIIIVNWNGIEDTIECIESLLRLEKCQYRIIICDNGSTDGSSEKILQWSLSKINEKHFGETRLLALLPSPDPLSWSASSLISFIEIGQNSGFAAANNAAIRIALHHGFDKIWLLNNDTIVDPLSAFYLTEEIEDNLDIGICGSTLIYYHQPQIVQGVGFRYNLLNTVGYQIGNGLSPYHLPDKSEVVQRIDYVIGASMFVRAAFIKDVGLMSERYFLYFEELDWATRAGKRWSLSWAPRSIVWHKEGATIGTSTTGRPSNRAIAFMSRSLVLFYARNRPWLLPVALLRIAFNLGRFFMRRDWSACKAVLRGLGRLHGDPKRLLGT